MLVCVVAHSAQPEAGVVFEELEDVIDQLDNNEYGYVYEWSIRG